MPVAPVAVVCSTGVAVGPHRLLLDKPGEFRVLVLQQCRRRVVFHDPSCSSQNSMDFHITAARSSSNMQRTGVCSLKLGLTFTEDKDEVAVNNRVNSVCYCQHCAVPKLLADGSLDNCISGGVDRSSCLVEYKDVASL